MPGWFAEAIARLADNPWLQAVTAALATFVLEDPTTIGCGLLVADGKMSYLAALCGVFGGIVLGDLGLYGLGRLLGGRLVGWGFIGAERLERAAIWFRHNLLAAVVLSRFVPGLRLPTYLGAGVLRAPFHRFLLVVVGASLVWTVLLLSITLAVGEAILPVLGRARWPVAIGVLAFFVFVQRRAARQLEAVSDRERYGRSVSPFEFWPPWLFYIPVGAYYAWLALRHRSVLLPTAANPSIYSGGLIGESKSEILNLVPRSHRGWVAPWVVVDCAPGDTVDVLAARASRSLAEAGIDYPLVAKPDVGQRGAGVRPIRSEDALREYLAEFPRGCRLMLQKMVGAPSEARGGGNGEIREAGVLYWRRPGNGEEGRIFSMTLKRIPFVTGDGRRTVRELILADPRARHLAGLYLGRHAKIAAAVLPLDEELPLVFSGNHCQGAVFLDGTRRVTPELLMRIDDIARSMPEFYFGRFDVRFDDLGAFLRGEDLQIVEVNGAGAEATHIWDASARLSEAYATLFDQFRILFSIGAANRRRGFRPMGLGRFLRDALAYRRSARTYPPTH